MKKRRGLLFYMMFVTVFVASVGFYAYQALYAPNILVDRPSTYIYIPTGAEFKKDVLEPLHESNVVEDGLSFAFISKLVGYQDEVKPGRYYMEKNMSNVDAIRMLKSGRQQPVDVTFNYLRLKEQVAKELTEELEAREEDFLALLDSSQYVEYYGFDTLTVATMFLPNTYEFYWNTSATEVFERMHNEYQKFWTEEKMKKADSLGLSPEEVSILASIVESETSKNDEKPIVAGLYLNRLRIGMPLQADPTLVFAHGDFSMRRVYRKHREIESPYNTYKNAGLPPGPIRIPQLSSINAVLNARQHDYIYMVADWERQGYHVFNSSQREHINAANRYRRWLNRKEIY